MFRYLVRRLFLLLLVLFGVMILVFAVGRMIPGDPARVMLGERATEEMVQNMRVKLGLNEPVVVQFGIYFINVIKGDLGTSITQFQPVIKIIQSNFMATFELALMSVIWAVLIGIPVGILAAKKKDTIFDYTSMTIALFGVSMPVFWIGLIFILVFSVQLNWLPASGREIGLFDAFGELFRTGDFSVLWEAFSHIIMPSLALGSMFTAMIARMTRSSMLEVLDENYIETARAKGVKESRVINRHARKNAMIPVVTVIGMQIGSLMGGAVLTETVFAWPGIGRQLVEAIFARDYPLFQGIILMAAMFFAVANLIVDLLYGVLDPRIKLQ
ncbi:MAG TPA: ABC transporter permease [Thermotogota bacterium]|nr:ABC transporter permease [Thermotogota bacterium]HPJ88778.1 ABC transporter permease [Thermotogota bacterium]HPR96281.1 ABC transporter permease [Thermotogota bacterium]